ncbi:MAG: succinyl-diaminopimelate desuccinylase, partial [Corynebacterium variabile]
MNEKTAQLDLTLDPVSLTAALVDIPSRSHEETVIADTLESGLVRLALPGVTVDRRGNTVIARTHRGLPTRVI